MLEGLLQQTCCLSQIQLQKTSGEDSNWLGLEKESVPGPINFGHERKWMFQMEAAAVSGRGRRTGASMQLRSGEARRPASPSTQGQFSSTLKRTVSFFMQFFKDTHQYKNKKQVMP